MQFPILAPIFSDSNGYNDYSLIRMPAPVKSFKSRFKKKKQKQQYSLSLTRFNFPANSDAKESKMNLNSQDLEEVKERDSLIVFDDEE